MKCDEIFLALEMLEKERGISQTFMMDKIIQAIAHALSEQLRAGGRTVAESHRDLGRV